MANRELTVKARIVADTADAQRNLRAVAEAQQLVASKMRDVQAAYDSGSLSADKFVAQQARLERQAGRLASQMDSAKRAIAGISDETARTSTGVAGLTSIFTRFFGVGAGIAAVRKGFRDLDANVARLGTTSAETASKLEASLAFIDGFGNRISAFFSGFAAAGVSAFEGMVAAIARVRIALAEFSIGVIDLIQMVPGLSGAFQGFENTLRSIEAEQRIFRADALAASQAASDTADALLEFAFTATKASEKTADLATSTSVVTDETELAAESTLVWNRHLGIWIDTATVVNTEVGRMISHYRDVRSEVLQAASAFDDLSAAQGRAAAVAASLAAGGTLSSAGRRTSGGLLVPGASRLTSAPGLTGFVGRSSLGHEPLRPRRRVSGGTP